MKKHFCRQRPNIEQWPPRCEICGRFVEWPKPQLFMFEGEKVQAFMTDMTTLDDVIELFDQMVRTGQSFTFSPQHLELIVKALKLAKEERATTTE